VLKNQDRGDENNQLFESILLDTQPSLEAGVPGGGRGDDSMGCTGLSSKRAEGEVFNQGEPDDE
jgi:hypothetical protein